jgi:tetratricopeptide (TPR) repeat protein
MKKYILMLTAVVISSVVYSQKNKVQSAISYNKAFSRSGKCSEIQKGLDAINPAIEHESTKGWAKTWYYRGNLYYNILASKDQACKSIDKDALEKCTDSYLKTLILNFEDPELKKLDLEKEDGSDMMKFFGAMQDKSNKVDDPMFTADIMGRKFPGLAGEYANKGIKQYGDKDFKGAQESFGKSLLLGQMGMRLDTMIMFNMALASEAAKDFDVAKQMYDGLIMMKYNIDGNGPSLYFSMAKIYKNEGDTAKAMEYISKGRAAYPSNQNLIFDEIDHYLKSGRNEDALNNLNTAIENDNKNAFLYYVRGTVYDKLKQEDNAIADYKKSVELDPKQHDALYNLGAFYFNKGADKVNEGNDLPLSATTKFNALQKEAKEAFETSIPYIEKANAAKPEDTATADMLIKAYTRTNQFDKAKALKAKYQ